MIFAIFAWIVPVMMLSVVSLPVQINSGSLTQLTVQNVENDAIIFPNSYEQILDLVPRSSNISKCAQGNTYCENLDRYPHNYVKRIMQKSHGFDVFFGDDDAAENDLIERDRGTERFVCAAISRVIYPQGGKNTRNQWKLIVNHGDEGYMQGIRIEECAKTNRPCDIIGELPDGLETSCKQKYVYRRLLALSDDGKPAVDTFLFPSACCCSYKWNFAMFLRSSASNR